MLKLFSIFILCVVLLNPVLAADAAVVSQNAMQASIDEANRYLSAENSRALTAMRQSIVDELKGYQDENFQTLDGRMQTLMYDVKMRIILGGIGSMLLASGLVAMAYMWITRRYSYENYLQNVIKKYEETSKEPVQFKQAEPPVLRGMSDLHDPQGWNYGGPLQSMTGSGTIDQMQAGEVSMLNEHQHDPVYKGAWVPEQGQGLYGQTPDMSAKPYIEQPDESQRELYSQQNQQWRPN